MFKRMIIFCAITIFTITTSDVVAHADLHDKKKYYDDEIDQIEKEIKEIDDKKELIDLGIERNKLAAYQKAYEKAIELGGSVPKMTIKGHSSTNQYIEIYKAAAERYKIDWTILAAIHEKETNFSTHETMISSAGAIGHMQFMPATWEYYGVDGNKDGKIDPWNVDDAIFSAANYLAATGAADNRVKESLFAYNRSKKYGNDIIIRANEFKEAYSDNNVDVVDVGKKFIGNSTYVFGGGRNNSDISKGIFDCSSFVRWAFDEIGKDVGHLTSTTTDTLKLLGSSIDLKDIKEGDLVFFDTYKKDGHVGIYAGNGQFIGAQTSTGVAIADMTTGYWKDNFNGLVKRIN